MFVCWAPVKYGLFQWWSAQFVSCVYVIISQAITDFSSGHCYCLYCCFHSCSFACVIYCIPAIFCYFVCFSLICFCFVCLLKTCICLKSTFIRLPCMCLPYWDCLNMPGWDLLIAPVGLPCWDCLLLLTPCNITCLSEANTSRCLYMYLLYASLLQWDTSHLHVNMLYI